MVTRECTHCIAANECGFMMMLRTGNELGTLLISSPFTFFAHNEQENPYPFRPFAELSFFVAHALHSRFGDDDEFIPINVMKEFTHATPPGLVDTDKDGGKDDSGSGKRKRVEGDGSFGAAKGKRSGPSSSTTTDSSLSWSFLLASFFATLYGFVVC